MSRYPRRKRSAAGEPEALARGLGWFSMGVGLARIFAPRAVARLLGVPLPSSLTLLIGLRELACGAGLLTQQQPSTWLRARLAGDAMDLGVLALGAALPGTRVRHIAASAAVVAGVTALDLFCSRALARGGRRAPPRHEALAMDVDLPPEALYTFWRDFSNLPRIMPHLESVQVLDERHSHWVAAGPSGTRVEWDTEVIDDRPGVCLAWRSVEGSPVFSAGSVQFAPLGGGGSRLRVEILSEMTPASVGEAVGELFGRDAAHRARIDLRELGDAAAEHRAPL